MFVLLHPTRAQICPLGPGPILSIIYHFLFHHDFHPYIGSPDLNILSEGTLVPREIMESLTKRFAPHPE